MRRFKLLSLAIAGAIALPAAAVAAPAGEATDLDQVVVTANFIQGTSVRPSPM